MGEHREFNRRINETVPSKSVTLLAMAREMERKDPDIINLTGGEPDFPTPRPICDEIGRQLAAGYTHYTDSRGEEDLRLRIAGKLSEENHIKCSADQILITPGAKYAVYLTVRALINPGDEVIYLTPRWVSYPSIVHSSGGMPVAARLRYEDGYCIREEILEAAVSDRTKLLIINYPNNPTGKILDPSDLEVLCAFLRRHPGVWVLSDEIYEKIIFDGKAHLSIASIPEFSSRTVVVNGFSKSCAMTGHRVGYLFAPDDLYGVIHKLFQHSVSCVSGFLQKGAQVAIECAAETEMMRASYEKRRNILVEGMRDIKGAQMFCPSGAFYAWVKFDLGLGSDELCRDLLEKAKIAGVPGSAYGERYAECVRFSFAAAEKKLHMMLENLRRYCKKQ